jgi:hypothetical protein
VIEATGGVGVSRRDESGVLLQSREIWMEEKECYSEWISTSKGGEVGIRMQREREKERERERERE